MSGPGTLAERLAWTATGTRLVDTIVGGMDDPGFDAPSLLPGWSRRHLVAHLAANAEAIVNLVHWATSGEPTPMYASAEARRDGIEAGAQRHPAELRAWYRQASGRLEEDMAALPTEAWSRPIVTAQGRTVPATEIPWMRAREVLIHAVDLDEGVSFADLPPEFVLALGDEIAARRGTSVEGPAVQMIATDTPVRWRLGGQGTPVAISGPVAELVAYLAGRPTAVTGPDLPPWL